MSKKIIAIWAEDETGLIGADNRLPWRLPKELQHFKETTMGQALLMGRVTFDGMNRRILPGRETLILTRQPDLEAEGVVVVTSPEQALDWFAQQDKDLFVVGGASIYQTLLPYCDRLIKTTVQGHFEGDTYFPDLDFSAFEKKAERFFEADEQNPCAFTVTTYDKRKED